MRKRVLFTTLLAAALLVAPVAGTDAKPDGDRGPTKSKKCEKPNRVGFKINGTFGGYLDPELTVAVEHANKHARRWLDLNSPSFDTSDAPKIKFIGVTDTGDGTVGFEDAVETDRVKLKAKLVRPKRGCEGDIELRVKKITVKRPHAAP